MPDRRGRTSHTRRYPRTARVNEVLREIVAEALEEVSDDDERLNLVTVTGIEAEPDLRHAKVFYAARTEGADEALVEQRVRLQAAIARQTRLKRTPQLSFVVDTGVTTGWRIEEVLKGLDTQHDSDDGD
ncbi:MAG: ribosome-binding factor [Actinomycetota bacterium]|jgi:ribosome-binding factor A|nr:ribosome-binding factor [Actinomycetota bacterium]